MARARTSLACSPIAEALRAFQRGGNPVITIDYVLVPDGPDAEHVPVQRGSVSFAWPATMRGEERG